MRHYEGCTLCPRMCGADRVNGKTGVCRAGALPRVAHSMLHMWEEPSISGKNGSGTVFFSGCPLGCVYCQNSKISRDYVGAEYDSSALSALFLRLQEEGAHNINLVTATHFVPHVIEAVSMARERGLSVPIVYNTSGYERTETIDMLGGTADIYLTDIRYAQAKTASAYSRAADYPDVAWQALAHMVAQTGMPVLDEAGMMRRGVIVRLLLLPGHLIEAKQILRRVYSTYGDGVYISLMSQYTPTREAALADSILGRRVKAYEYASLVEYARTIGVSLAYTQEGSAAEESFIPHFEPEKMEKSL